MKATSGSEPPQKDPSRQKSVQFTNFKNSKSIPSISAEPGKKSFRLELNQKPSVNGLAGFVDGDSSSGKVRDLNYDWTWDTSYESSGVLFAVGLSKSVDLLETTDYTRIHSISREDKVSSVKWLGSLLAVGGLDGCVSLYKIRLDLLEIQGPNLLHEFYCEGQVRALDIQCIASSESKRKILVATGDKTGAVTFSSFCPSLEHVETKVVQNHEVGVLGLAIHSDRGLFATTLKDGTVLVHELDKDKIILGSLIFETKRNGPVRSVLFSQDGSQLIFGGYDKTVSLVDTRVWSSFRELDLEGTINVISLDPLGRYLAVGTRGKFVTLYDTSTYIGIKTFHTPGWVTSISWGPTTTEKDILAVRSRSKEISLIDLTPIYLTDVKLSFDEAEEPSLSWSLDGRFVARVAGSCIAVTDSRNAFTSVASFEINDTVKKVAFCPAFENKDSLAFISADGYLTILRLKGPILEQVESVYVEKNLKALAWSLDGKLLTTGGNEKFLHVFECESLKQKIKPKQVGGRIWDISFSDVTGSIGPVMVIALGDYTAQILDTDSFEPILQIERSRTVRCCAFHPHLPILALGDGAGIVVSIDLLHEEVIHEMDMNGRPNTLDFSPSGDYIVIGTDNNCFTLHETISYMCVQEISSDGFAVVASFSSDGMYLALGTANERYSMVRLGPLLGTDLVPLDLNSGVEDELPPWAINEVLYRSGNGPSFVQRHMIKGTKENLRLVALILRNHPDSIYTFNRTNEEGCFDTVFLLKKPNLLKLALSILVDGTLGSGNDGRRSIFTTEIPEQGREALAYMVARYPPQYAVDVFQSMVFIKTPFSEPHIVQPGDHLDCGNPSYTDPWGTWHSSSQSKSSKDIEDSMKITRTSAVLPIAGLGSLRFLTSLVSNAPPEAFDNPAMKVVLKVMWRDHIRKYFLIDCILFLLYFTAWILLVDMTAATTSELESLEAAETLLAIVTLCLNSLFCAKECVQSGFGLRLDYFRSAWNVIDIVSITCVYVYCLHILVLANDNGGGGVVPLAVVTSLLLTAKLVSYLRGFGDTGWLVSVLIANFHDVQGFLIILFIILLGFTISFRLLFGNIDQAPFDSIRRSFLSTFEMTILGSYDPELLHNGDFTVLAVLTFILAVTCVLVVALNALISILADSYARVQVKATANRRKEKAELICEYMSILPRSRRRSIEDQTRYFHALLEADADGDLLIDGDSWEGGLHSLRHDMGEMIERNRTNHEKALEQMKSELDAEIINFKKQVVGMLEDLSGELKELTKVQKEGGITVSGRNVAKVVKAVKSIGLKTNQ